tara:strand:- start:637 stop:1206 length:570 start_codon:yes stop_codon:yes gene_type:complete
MRVLVLSLLSFIILSFLPSDRKTKTFVDARDGQEYQIVKIGKQWWFAENLNYEIDRSWCHECEEYGRMYTYEAAMKACPEGWHIPTVEEWKKLISHLGGNKKAGSKMRSLDKWRNAKTQFNNSSGFSAIPAPHRGTRGEVRNPRDARWWSSDIAPDPAAWAFILKPEDNTIEQLGFYRVSGFSVRCIKD